VTKNRHINVLTEEDYRELKEAQEEAALARIKASLEDAKAGRITRHASIEALLQHLDSEPIA
jgi:predicted transcriptional regulator